MIDATAANNYSAAQLLAAAVAVVVRPFPKFRIYFEPKFSIGGYAKKETQRDSVETDP